ncbi:ester hydrolase C11orf54 homolog [Camponotus floridanus]|uniref:ester hydrolase C11orf54 homolog n=1 Tax=Camponotus floridanus TaxID=104421 RepID=UPI000DC6BC8B|nr:ester hydrolase C11orf54 homolog [Camponotus floridanus]
MEPIPRPVPNNHHEDGNDIRPNDNAIGRDNHIEIENDIIPNGDALRENNHLENEDDIEPNNVIGGDNMRFEDDIEPNNVIGGDNMRFEDDIEPNNVIGEDNMRFEDDIQPNNVIGEDNVEFEDDIEPNNVIGEDNMRFGNDMRPNHINEGENPGGNIPNGYASDPEDEGQDVMSKSYPLDSLSLEHIKNVLYVGLHQLFDEFEIKVASCPCLTRPPYNLAAVGLSGNPSILITGNVKNLMPVPIKNSTNNIRRLLLQRCYNFFVIGAGYAAKESMPANGHFIINATISPPENVINNSRIGYEEANTGERILKIINDPNEMKCSMLGNFYLSEGRPGNVIEVRAKGCRTSDYIITLIQSCLYHYQNDKDIGLGGVLMTNGGRVMQLITPENYPERFRTLQDFYRWLRWHELKRNLITVGALANMPIHYFGHLRNEGTIFEVTDSFKFHSFSNHDAVGQFMNDVTPNETEYVCYFNVAQKCYFA